ncbi:PLP-dependent cysteine synthase family protein [Salininema proteolyticum]|uniref:PLP-dependent cysteine synthase family protein n=1 Tax=Salininema proteolyticum TaxID=1607685 RepID=A0ABV8TWB0_9ACTN
MTMETPAHTPTLPGTRPPASGPRRGRTADLVGDTPVVWIGDGERGYWAKLEGCNPGGIKDRAALHLVERARARGDLTPGAPIVESTSGTFGLGLALAGIHRGHPVVLVADPGLEPSMRHMLRAFGARLVIVPRAHPTGGWQESRREAVRGLLRTEPGSWCPDQYHNPDVAEGYEPLGEELVARLGGVDVLVCAVGTGGHSAGAFAGVRRHCPRARLVGVDSVGSTVFGQPAAPRLMRGLGSSIHPRNVNHRLFSEVHWVPPHLAVAEARGLAARHFATGGWSVGAVAAVADFLARTEPPGTRIAAVFPDGPDRYAGTVFNDEYCAQHGLLDVSVPREPWLITDPLAETAETWCRTFNVVDPVRSGADDEGGSRDREKAETGRSRGASGPARLRTGGGVR